MRIFVYENLIDLTNDPDVIGPLLWLRQREIVHYARFKELFNYDEKILKNGENNFDNQKQQMYYKNNEYLINQLQMNPKDYFM